MSTIRLRPVWVAGLLAGGLLLMGTAPAPEGGKPAGAPQMQGKRQGPGGIGGGAMGGGGMGPASRRGRRAGGKDEGGRPGAGGGRMPREGAGNGAEGADGAEGGRKRPGTAVGNMLLRQGGLKAAVDSFEQQLEKNPGAPAANVGLGKALARMGKCEEALEHLWPFVGTLPFGGDAAIAASTCSSRLGLLSDAIYFDRIAIDLKPDSARALSNLALDLSSAGDNVGTDEALEELLFLREGRDASAYARATLALRAGDIDDFDRVIATWERDDGPSLDLRRLQAQSWLDLDNPMAAEASLKKIAQIRNGNQVRYLRAEAARRMGFPSDAASQLADRPQSVLEGVDNDAIRARVYVDEGDFQKAHEVLAGYEDLPDPEIIASTWYLASREGRTADLPALEAAYEQARVSPLRDLSHLVPWPLRTK